MILKIAIEAAVQTRLMIAFPRLSPGWTDGLGNAIFFIQFLMGSREFPG